MAHTEINETGSKCVGDRQHNGNKEESGKQEKVGQIGSIGFHQVLYVARLRISVRDILRENAEQSYQVICS
jgi:hypothetical protein